MDSQLDGFFRAWCAPKLSLLGYHIRDPYCLGHMLLLEGLCSPFENLDAGGVEITAADLLLALRVCSAATWPFRDVDTAPRVFDYFRRRWLEAKHGRLEWACAAFVAWQRECARRPEYWQSANADTAGVLTAPHQLARAVQLMRQTAMSERRVWTMSVGVLAWYAGTIAEQETGETHFFYDSDAEAAARLPDFNEMSDEDLYPLVVADRGEEFADQWLKDRITLRQNQSK